MAERQVQEGIRSLVDIDPLIHAPARLTVLTYLYVVASADFVFLKNMTGLTWGNLSTHLSKLEAAGYVTVEKTFKGKKPHTMVRLTEEGRAAFRAYKANMQQVLDDLPD
jgi:DNA-binding MarR family transcriptional regulator